jgi:hypothetical protein
VGNSNGALHRVGRFRIGAEIPVNKGRWNFDAALRVLRDATVALEAFKAATTTSVEASAKGGRPYDSRRRTAAGEAANKRPTGTQALRDELRRPLFRIAACARRWAALRLQWSNKTLFYGQYAHRYHFANPDSRQGSGREELILEKYRGRVPDGSSRA